MPTRLAPPRPCRFAGPRGGRRGVTIVEAALVLSVFLMLLFGIFEYCRFLLVLHVTNNATREGARYASVHLNKPPTFDSQNYTDPSGKVFPSVRQYTKDRMGGMWRNIEGFRVAVFAADQAGLSQTPPVIRPKPRPGTPPGVYPDPWNPNDPRAVPWNSAPFPERIVVYINGTYRPILPTLLMMPSSIPINVYALTGGEG
jgi:Flp pilus assembly protein TadG